jgi:signal transduction histidine kinase
MTDRLRRSVRVWLTMLTFVAFVPVTLFAAFTLNRLGSQQQSALTGDLSHRAEAAAAAVSQRLDVMVASLQTLAKSDAALHQDMHALYRHAQRVLELNPDATAIALIDPAGRQVFNTLKPFGSPLPVIGAPDAARAVFTENRPLVSELFMGTVNQRYIATVNIPLPIDGVPAFCLRMAIHPAALSRALEQQALPPEWTLAVIDQAGTIVARNRMADKLVGSRTSSQTLAAIREGRRGIYHSVTQEGVAVAAVIAPVSTWQWSVSLGLPIEHLNQSLDRSLAELAIGGIILLAASLLAALWGAQHLGDQIEAAAAATNGRADGTESEDRLAAELEATRQELGRSNADLEQFAYVASHDLREPLRMISTYISLLERRHGEALDESGREFIAFARDGAIKMDRLVLGLLEYSRIGRRGTPIAPMPVAEALEAALTSLSAEIEGNGVRIVVDWTALPTVLGDPLQLSLLFHILIGNAVKFRAASRPPEVCVSCRRAGTDWQFLVIDNGIGIEAQYFERIFAIFQRLHIQAEYEGTGLGLAVAKKIVERHGGSIWVESTPGTGSTFHFTLRAPPPGGAVPK